MAGPYLPIRSLNRSQNVRIGQGANAVVLNATTTSFVDISDGNVKRDLQRHSAIGSYIIVGDLTNSPQDTVVYTGGVVTPGTGVSVNTSAGELFTRSSGAYVVGVAGTNTALTLTTIGGQSQVFQIVWDNTSGAVAAVAGTPATTGTQKAPATAAGKTALANVTLAHAAASVVQGNIADVRPRL